MIIRDKWNAIEKSVTVAGDEFPCLYLDAKQSLAKTVAFVHDGDVDELFSIVGRVGKYANTLTDEKITAVVCISSQYERFEVGSILDELQPHAVINASRKLVGSIKIPDDFQDINPLRFLHRRWPARWSKTSTFPTVTTLPDENVIYRTYEGKWAKESAFRLGEWVEAFKAAIDGNHYTLNTNNYKSHLIDTWDKCLKFLDFLPKKKLVAIDTETRNLNRLRNQIATIQFAFNEHDAYVLPVHHPESPWSADQKKIILGRLREYFQTTDATHIYANGVFDILQLRRETGFLWYNGGVWDVQRARYCLNENLKYRSGVKQFKSKETISAFSLEQMVIEYGSSVYLRTAMGKAERTNIFGQPLNNVAEYGGIDVVLPLAIYKFQLDEIERRGPTYGRLEQVIREQSKATILSFVEMESTGLPIDTFYLAQESSTQGAFMVARQRLEKEFYALPEVKQANDLLIKSQHGADLFNRDSSKRWVFDINKPEHLRFLFFNVMKLESVGSGKSGEPTVGKAFKNRYAKKGDNGNYLDTALPAVRLYDEQSSSKQLFNSFLKAFFKKMVSDEDMRVDQHIRPRFKDLTIVTGRAGASDPSLQNVPSRSVLAKPIKRQFVTRMASPRIFKPNMAPVLATYKKPKLFIKGDFAAQEVRNFGICANDDLLVRPFIKLLNEKVKFRLLVSVTDEELEAWTKKFKAMDSHRANAELFFGIPAVEVTTAQRTQVKTLVFGTIYGMTAMRLALTLGITEEEAQALIDLLYDKFPDGVKYMVKTHKNGRLYIRVVSSIGRVRHLWGYLHCDSSVHKAMDRRGVNSRIQSVSSEEGFEGNYHAQRLRWHYFLSQGIDLGFDLANAVHDSTETMGFAEAVPVVAYIIENAYTTLVHKSYWQKYGMEFNVGLEMEIDIGPALSEMKEWNYRPENLRKLVDSSLDWQAETMKYKFDKKSIMSAFDYNNELMYDLRCKELRQLPENGVGEDIFLTRKIARKVKLL